MEGVSYWLSQGLGDQHTGVAEAGEGERGERVLSSVARPRG